ncbi:MAG: 2,3-bisphosphoglycerate-independent phosphoglycerate mutase [Phycisphaerae bacterium]|nr:2,3-bisphosphoglycerate-independent phosphoglycerate mutase [Phycisphaerae bacterium]
MARPIVLLVRDGWGIGPEYSGNAVRAARTPNTDALLATYPWCTLSASGEEVGVRAGSQGSSEVGHLNMGAGRVVTQEITRVDIAIRTGELWASPRLTAAIEQVKRNNGAFHLMGLVQDQGVHAVQEHLFALIKHLAAQQVKNVVVHFFSDGRDTPPQSALTYLDALEAAMKASGVGRIGSVMGRYWAMDRGENWDRTEKAYRALFEGQGLHARSARQAIEQAYARAAEQAAKGGIVETDEFIRPTLIVDASDKPVGLIQPGDAVLHTNFRQDRAIQLAHAFVDADFAHFNRGPAPKVFFMGLTRYWDQFTDELIPPMNMANLLGEVISRAGRHQLRIAEFQKYRHVTSFFNGKRIEPYGGEDRIQVASITIPEDRQPEMSAYPVTALALTAIRDGIAAVREQARNTPQTELETLPFPNETAADLANTYDFIVLNYANGDMVGHTGVFAAAVKAIETVDDCVGQIVQAVLERDGVLLVTADHGNAEQMVDMETGAPQTAHTTNPVHCILVSKNATGEKLIAHGKLSDVAPTILKLMHIDVPKEMTADNLIR